MKQLLTFVFLFMAIGLWAEPSIRTIRISGLKRVLWLFTLSRTASVIIMVEAS